MDSSEERRSAPAANDAGDPSRASREARIEPDPDHAEAELADAIDDAVPTRGYSMLPVVGLGGSAGAIGALQAFLAATGPDTGMAYVVVMHLAADHESVLAQILQRSTSMPVHQVNDTVKVEPGHVYVIPPGRAIASFDGSLALIDIEPERGRRVTVDLFFRTLADTHGPHAVAIVLSGADGDGAIGIKRIKERGGLTIAQDPDEAEHGGMPRAAIATGMIDWVLPVAAMPDRLVRLPGPRLGKLRLPAEDGLQPAARMRVRPTISRRAARGAGLPARPAPAATSSTTSARRSCAASRGACRSTASRSWPTTWRSCAPIPAKPARC